MKNMHKRFVIGAIAVLTIIAGGFAYTQLNREPVAEITQTPRIIEVTLAIADVLPTYRVEIDEGTSVLELIRKESIREGFVMSEKEYAGLGILVERLGDFENGTDGKYWTYTVNGVFAPVGADVYTPKAGDLIEWTFAVPKDIE